MAGAIGQVFVTGTKWMSDLLDAGGSQAGRYYTNFGGTLRESAERHSTTAFIGNRAFVSPGRRAPSQTTFSPAYLGERRGDTYRSGDIVTVERARPADAAGITRAHVLATEGAYQSLPNIARLKEFLLNSLGPRWIVNWRSQITAGEPIFVARTPDGGVAGFIHPKREPDGTGYLSAWYVLPGWQGVGVGRQLWSEASEYWGPTDIRLHVIANTDAEGIYRRKGFVATEPMIDTPPQLAEYDIVAPLQGYTRLDRSGGAAGTRPPDG
ncbi:MAG: GNAT family N-acetyltransferase [Nocardia sp.]|nr:GNAT family N-acetyltransferase [Nocardia sp.]